MTLSEIASLPAGEVMNASPSPPSFTGSLHHAEETLSRKRRMDFFDLANLLDSDGNLQNEMMVFAFAATMLSTIPILLGNEFDVNVGLRKRRHAGPYKDPDEVKTKGYYRDHFSPSALSGYTYKQLMTLPHISHKHSTTTDQPFTQERWPKNATADSSLTDLLKNLLQWSEKEVKTKSLMVNLINLFLDRFNGYSNPADKLIATAYKKWKKFWY